MYEIVIYTASKKEYASNIMDFTCISNYVDRKFCIDYCEAVNNNQYIKNLNIIMPDLSEILSTGYFYTNTPDNINNFIFVKAWCGVPGNTALTDILPLLFTLSCVKDVRSILKLHNIYY
ncbi:hypothetical protein cand_000900 [Cryptosporidium andersoni]|uniref:FCP1 homology domain-containing protein n=1 Tax=Cryptosporidium andersoni TaxID=117008 RepID=A0A1J4MQN2_9CRYT|nr:hypothetical protein cand_000900 [Cryptosporidium andersoni]